MVIIIYFTLNFEEPLMDNGVILTVKTCQFGALAAQKIYTPGLVGPLRNFHYPPLDLNTVKLYELT